MKFDIPNTPKNIKSFDYYDNRSDYIKKYGFTYFSWNWLNPLINYLKDRKCLEVMAGAGAFSYILRERGVNVIATDNMEWHNLGQYKDTWGKHLWTNIENLDAITAVKKYGKKINVLIMSWAYMDKTAYKVIKEMHKVNSNAIVLYIGEGEEGCTADNNFFRSFEEINNKDFNKISKEYFKAQWYGIHDYITFGKYNYEKDKRKLILKGV